MFIIQKTQELKTVLLKPSYWVLKDTIQQTETKPRIPPLIVDKGQFIGITTVIQK